LPDFIIRSITGNEPAQANLSAEERRLWAQQLTGKPGLMDQIATGISNRIAAGISEQVLGNEPNSEQNAQTVYVNGNTVYFGRSPASPNIGDVRITLFKTMPSGISLIAKVNGSTFEQYIAESGKSFSSVAMGTVSAEKMFAGEHSTNKIMTWLLRFLGLFLVIRGLKSMFSILPALFKVLPFIGNIVGAGIGLVCSVFGGAWSLLIISISWLWYRPLIGVSLLAIAIAGIWYLKKKAKNSG
ncbi:MAG: TMEM43 family protein, partial [Tannerella sp.]|jgi:hypothetical protein|nr:TMEM43 family protein [Tannerella sp.]